jgi:hypothetical protein
MAVPGSGTLSLLQIWSEKNENDYTSNNTDGESNFSLRGLSSNSHDDSSNGNINLKGSGGGNGVQAQEAPYSMSEFYGYDHDGGPSIGSYGNSSNTQMFSGDQGTGQVTNSNIDLSGAAYVGESLIGATGHIFFRFESGTSFRSDAQVKRIIYNTNSVFKSFSSSGVNGIETTSLTTNTAYNHSSTWIQIANATTNGRWNQRNGTPPSSGTGVSADGLYYESSSNGSNKDVYLRFPEITFSSNTMTYEGYGYGSNMGTLFLGIYITG